MAEPPAPARLDARGLKCPLPAIKTQRALAALAPGAELLVLATDPMARIDIPHLCQKAGHRLLSLEAEDGELRFRIARASAP